MRGFLLVLSAVLAAVSAQKDPHFVDGHNTIVHLFEWKYSDIAAECENFLGPMGFGGVQTSVPSENVIVDGRPWWERYQPISYVLTTRSGDADAFEDMCKRCNAVGVRIYPDVVFNHMAAQSGTGTAGNTDDANNKYYPAVPYSSENFHESCSITDYNDPSNVRNCELEGLKDLDQSQEYVRGKIRDFLNDLISRGVAGFRVDAAKHMWPADLEAIFSSLNDLSTDHGFSSGSRAYIYQEVIDTGDDAIKNTEYTGFGSVVEFKCGVQLSACFQGQNALQYLENWGTGWGLIEGGSGLIMVDNHDTQRSGTVLTYKNSKPYKAAIAFMLAHPYNAVTRVMSSYSFDSNDQAPPDSGPGSTTGTCDNGWVCEHRWRQIYNMVKFRQAASGTDMANWWTDGNEQIAFSRGNVGFVAFTTSGDINQSLPTGLPAGTYCDIISGELENGSCTGKSVTVDDSGYGQISLSSGEDDAVLAIYTGAKL